RVLFRSDLRGKKFREFYNRYIINSDEPNAKIVFAAMLGVFIGVAPIWGWQIVAGITLAHIFRLNKVITVVASHISIPPMIPVILYVSYIFGGIILSHDTHNISYNASISFELVAKNAVQYVVGALLLGIALAVVTGTVTAVLLAVFRKKPIS
ncbi:MAG: DUF2062 domain-containing protein, partial [Bacteroidetes bacterium]|nr:DUF2062 domain-containing protein [Bacteroidota bacterium]